MPHIDFSCLFLHHGKSPQVLSPPTDKHGPSMQSEVVGLGRDILLKVSVSFTGEGSTGEPGWQSSS